MGLCDQGCPDLDRIIDDLGKRYHDKVFVWSIRGRKKNVITRGGVNISPLQVDRVLLEHPDVAEAATVGIPDAIFGEEVVALREETHDG